MRRRDSSKRRGVAPSSATASITRLLSVAATLARARRLSTHFARLTNRFHLVKREMDKQRYIVGPVAKALLVLDAVAEGEDGVRLSHVSARTGLPKTTAFRYLCTLEAAGYVDCDPAAELYRAGARLHALGRAADPAKRLRATALPIMTELRDRFDETVNLGVLRGGNIVYVEIVECRRRLRL